MRASLVRFVPLVLIGITFSPGSAQETSRQFGLGLGLQDLSVISLEEAAVLNVTPQAYVPFMISDAIMIEPGIGYFRSSVSVDSEFGDSEETLSALRLGVGVLFMIAPAERGRIYAGPRVGILRISSEDEFDGGSDEFTRTDLILSGVLGGEFFLLPAFSLGGEASANYVRMGEADTGEDTDVEIDGSLITIGTEFRVRWYIR